MEQALASGGDSSEVVICTPERDQIYNVRSAKRVARGGDGPSKRQIADGLGAIRTMYSDIQASCERVEASHVSYKESIHELSHLQREQGVYLRRLEVEMQVQINDVLLQQNSMQEQLFDIKSNEDKIMSLLEMSQNENKLDKDGIEVKNIVSELRSTTNKLTAIARQHNTGVSEVRGRSGEVMMRKGSLQARGHGRHSCSPQQPAVAVEQKQSSVFEGKSSKEPTAHPIHRKRRTPFASPSPCKRAKLSSSQELSNPMHDVGSVHDTKAKGKAAIENPLNAMPVGTDTVKASQQRGASASASASGETLKANNIEDPQEVTMASVSGSALRESLKTQIVNTALQTMPSASASASASASMESLKTNSIEDLQEVGDNTPAANEIVKTSLQTMASASANATASASRESVKANNIEDLQEVGDNNPLEGFLR
ncbi:hypothetical protein L7F22_065028 [Adiantum nelumboides]|nr:hypothetical protein [Adiantum nelumboides]